MGCACKKGKNQTQYVWTSDDGETQVVYPSLMQAKAKVARKGGSFTTKAG